MFKGTKTLSQRIQRHGTIAIKTLFRIEIIKIIIPQRTITSSSLLPSSEISVCFERGGKIASTTDRPIVVYNDNYEVIFNETLSLVVTMYKTTTNEYQVRFIRLSVC